MVLLWEPLLVDRIFSFQLGGLEVLIGVWLGLAFLLII